ncbi:MAG: putative DNA-binding domain-containing protein [Methylotenera sp.]|nr:putative DNA-binding domain-containing protein [Methylotenera sp.]
MSTGLPSFQRYQLAFTAHIRDPLHQPRPEGVVASGMAVYKEIVFNNLLASVSACFPVAQKVIGKRAWLKLTQAFLREHAANTPIFRQIPEEFLSFLATATSNNQPLLPPYLLSLCHYEWIELLVASMPVPTLRIEIINPQGDLLTEHPVFTPTMQLLNYDYAVHKISPRNKPKQPQSTQLLVYRNVEDEVKFIAINLVTFRLLTLLRQNKGTGKQALTLITSEMHEATSGKIIQFWLQTLEELKSQGVIIGTLKPEAT